MEFRLSSDKLERVNGLGQKAVKCHDMESSLVGLLQHTAKVVQLGQSFVCHIIELTLSVKSRGCFVRLNTDFRSDVQWWCLFLEGWSEIDILPNPAVGGVSVESDALGGWGCVAV